MSLAEWVGRTLEEVEPDSVIIRRLLVAAERNIADARVTQISVENRFDAAYKAIMQIANAALQANGYRTKSSVPGHHRTMIRLLAETAGIDNDTIIVLDALRKQRNAADYSGDTVPQTALDTCLDQAADLLRRVTDWIEANRPQLLR